MIDAPGKISRMRHEITRYEAMIACNLDNIAKEEYIMKKNAELLRNPVPAPVQVEAVG
jgi:hypothetical protein